MVGYEAHDVGLVVQALSTGFFLDKFLGVCRTGANLGLPSKNAQVMDAYGIVWYDTNQKHIVTNGVFRNCGYRSNDFTQYDNSPTRGCGDDTSTGCNSKSTVFGFITGKDQFTPEIMQATRNIKFDNCGRRFRYTESQVEAVSGRHQNWIDADGSISGNGEETLVVSGLPSVKSWWEVDDEGKHFIPKVQR